MDQRLTHLRMPALHVCGASTMLKAVTSVQSLYMSSIGSRAFCFCCAVAPYIEVTSWHLDQADDSPAF